MRFPERALGEDEVVVVHEHPHWKTLVMPTLLVPIAVGIAVFSVAVMPAGRLQAAGRGAVAGVAALVLLAFAVVPWLRWRTSHFVLTDQRIMTRTGIVSRDGRDIPLARVNDVGFHHSLAERMFGCGTLVVESGGERGQLLVDDIPRVEAVQRELAALVERYLASERGTPDERRSAVDLDTWAPD